jgi:hypothetical protein
MALAPCLSRGSLRRLRATIKQVQTNVALRSCFRQRYGLQTRGFFRPVIGISRKLIAMNSLIEEPCLHGPGCHPFRYLSRSIGFPSIMACRLGRNFSAPSPEKRLVPFHFGLPLGSAVVSGFGRLR